MKQIIYRHGDSESRSKVTLRIYTRPEWFASEESRSLLWNPAFVDDGVYATAVSIGETNLSSVSKETSRPSLN